MRCIALDPKHVAAHYSLGSTAGLRKDYARAEEMYRKAIELDPSYGAAYSFLGSVLYQRKDYNGAEEMYRKVIELDPSNAWARQKLADLSSSNNRGCACCIQ